MNAVDLEIRVTTPWNQGDGHVLSFELHAPALDLFRMPFTGESLSDPEAFRDRLLERLENLGRLRGEDKEWRMPEEVLEELELIGVNLYEELFPPLLKETYWKKLRDNVRTILLISDEAWIPWEIVKPYRNDGDVDEDDDDFLCVRFAMGRWLVGKEGTNASGPAQTFQVDELAAVTVAKSYAPKAPKLAHVARERKLLDRLASEGGIRSCDFAEASFEQVKRLFDEGGRDLLHFSGHGTASKIHLADRSLSFELLAGRLAVRLRSKRPFVFFNACRTARQTLSLTGRDGWSVRWVLRCGCGALLAPLWTVNDDRAFEFAELFYEEARRKPLGEAVRSARERLRDRHPNDPAWLAYCLYGHPEARIVFGNADTGDVPPDTPPGPVDPPPLPVKTNPWRLKVAAAVLAILAAVLVDLATTPAPAKIGQLDDRPRIAGSLERRGLGTLRKAQLSEAWDAYEEAAGLYRDLGDDHRFAVVLTRLGEILLHTGFPHEARELEEAALVTLSETDPQEACYSRLRLGETLLALDDFKGARKHLESARACLEGSGRLHGEVLLALARLELAKDNVGNASAFASEAADELLDAREQELTFLAQILMVRARSTDSSAAGIYDGIRINVRTGDFPQARLDAALVETLLEGPERPLKDPELEDVLAAAVNAAGKGYVLAVSKARDEVRARVSRKAVGRFEKLIAGAQAEWTPRGQRALELLK